MPGARSQVRSKSRLRSLSQPHFPGCQSERRALPAECALDVGRADAEQIADCSGNVGILGARKSCDGLQHKIGHEHFINTMNEVKAKLLEGLIVGRADFTTITAVSIQVPEEQRHCNRTNRFRVGPN